ncbi:hypothetical protein H8D36_03030 [archaeon]|nr:hypothetical protein [archaeon]MBL7057040.1 hypothetical protein [Candidatus Woesearchaeota archaeon]
MNLDVYLEKDITEFLEKKELERRQKELKDTAPKVEDFSMEQDFYKDFQEALDKRDLFKAKKIFDQTQRLTANAESEEDKNNYTDMVENMYTDLMSFSAEEDSEKEFIHNLKGMDSLQTEFGTEVNDNGLEKKKIKIKNEIALSVQKISEFLQNTDGAAAMTEYKKMRGSFNEYPANPKHEKEELFNDIISSYYQIKKLEKIKKLESNRTQKKKDEKREKILTDAKENILVFTHKIQVFLKEKELKKAMEEYEQAKVMFEKFPEKYSEERKALYTHLLDLYKDIKKKAEEIKGKNKIVIKKKVIEKQIEEKEVEEKDKDKRSHSFIVDLKKEVRDIILLMKDHKIKEAEMNLLEVKRKMHWFPEGKDNEKQQFEHLIEEINHRINFLKQTPKIKND